MVFGRAPVEEHRPSTAAAVPGSIRSGGLGRFELSENLEKRMETEQFWSAFGNEKNYARPATQRTPRARKSKQGTPLQENYTKTTNWPSAAREVAMPSAPLVVLDQKNVQMFKDCCILEGVFWCRQKSSHTRWHRQQRRSTMACSGSLETVSSAKRHILDPWKNRV